jgi:hypothetical protein
MRASLARPGQGNHGVRANPKKAALSSAFEFGKRWCQTEDFRQSSDCSPAKGAPITKQGFHTISNLRGLLDLAACLLVTQTQTGDAFRTRSNTIKLCTK